MESSGFRASEEISYAEAMRAWLARLFRRQKDETTPAEGLAIPEHESGVRRLLADAKGTEYKAYADLAEARLDADAAVVLEGDDGGQIYLTCPVRRLRCDEQALRDLLRALDQIAWPGSHESSTGVLYEHRPVGTGVSGGMGGGVVVDGVWVHEEFESHGVHENGPTVADAARSVIDGEAHSLPPPPYFALRSD